MESSNCTTKTRSSKSRGFKTKLFLCFRPVGAVDDDALEPSTYSSILSSALTTVAECNEGSGGWRRWRKNRDDENSCFWHILKKALNHTTLLKKIKNRKKANKTETTRSSILKQERKSGKFSKEESKSIRSSLGSSASSSILTHSSLLSSSTNSSSSSSRTLPSSSSSSPPTLPCSTNNGIIFGLTIKKHLEDTKDSGKGLIVSNRNNNKNNNNNNNGTLFFPMISSLVVLVFWGKFFAILCTSLWFYLIPRRKRLCDRAAGDDRVAADEFDSVEYKKKIIMKGLLQRNHSRLSMDSNNNAKS